MCRNAVNGERFLEMSKLKELTMGKSKQTGPTGTLSDISSILGGGGSRDGKSLALSNSKQLPPLMRAGKELAFEDNELVR